MTSIWIVSAITAERWGLLSQVVRRTGNLLLSVLESDRKMLQSWRTLRVVMAPGLVDKSQPLKLLLCACNRWRTNFIINKFTIKLVKPAHFGCQINTAAHSEQDRSMYPKSWHAPGAGQWRKWEEATQGKQSYWWRKFGKVALWASCGCLCSGAKLAGVRGRTAKSPNPEQICPANCTTLQKVSMSTSNFNLNLGL